MIPVNDASGLEAPAVVRAVRAAPGRADPALRERDRTRHAALFVALAIGALVRGWHLAGVDFPLNDGGLFYVMVRDIQRAHYHLPAFTSYNGGQIPFGYSPLTFYLAAALNAAGFDLLALFRVLPFLASTGCIAAFYLLARDMLVTDVTLGRDPRTARATLAAALIAFAIAPRGFVWLLMGGGLTRSFGYLFALLALHQIWLLYTRRSLRYVPLASVFSALTVLCHLGTAPFVAFSALFLLIARGRHREGVVGSMLIGAGALLLSAPWWWSVVSMHGVGPFLAARATGGSVFSDVAASHRGPARIPGLLARIAMGSTGEGRFPIVWILALLGVVWCVRERRLLLPLWWGTILLLDTRAGSTYSAAPVAMLAGLSAVYIIRPLAMRRRANGAPVVPQRLALALGALVVLTAVIASSSRALGFRNETGVLTALSPRDREPMLWMAAHTDPGARVLVLTQAPWQIDKVSEWFPVLAERTSVATVQGTEWLPHHAFDAYITRQLAVARCGGAGVACLDSLSEVPELRFTHVYVPNGAGVACCRTLLDALRADPHFRLIYDDAGATVFARS